MALSCSANADSAVNLAIIFWPGWAEAAVVKENLAVDRGGHRIVWVVLGLVDLSVSRGLMQAWSFQFKLRGLVLPKAPNRGKR